MSPVDILSHHGLQLVILGLVYIMGWRCGGIYMKNCNGSSVNHIFLGDVYLFLPEYTFVFLPVQMHTHTLVYSHADVDSWQIFASGCWSSNSWRWEALGKFPVPAWHNGHPICLSRYTWCMCFGRSSNQWSPYRIHGALPSCFYYPEDAFDDTHATADVGVSLYL